MLRSSKNCNGFKDSKESDCLTDLTPFLGDEPCTSNCILHENV